MKKITLLMAIVVMATIGLQAQFNRDIEGMTGWYKFDNTDDIFMNSVTGVPGSVMCEGVMKFLPDAPSSSEDDQPSVEGDDWNVVDGLNGGKAINMNAHNWFKIWHGIPANGGGDYVNDFTVVMDVRVFVADGIYSLFEVNPTPSENGYTSELEIAEALNVGSVGAPASGEDALGFSTNSITVDTWYRIVYAAHLSTGIYIYVNGEIWHQMEGDFLDARPAPYGVDNNPDDAAFKVGGNNEGLPANDPPRDGDKEIDMVAVFNRTLSADEIVSLGGPGSWLGVNDIQNENSIKLYPNPANDILNVSVTDASTLEIISVTGQIVLSTLVENKNSTIDVSRLNRGIYFVKVTGNDGNAITQKLMIK